MVLDVSDLCYPSLFNAFKLRRQENTDKYFTTSIDIHICEDIGICGFRAGLGSGCSTRSVAFLVVPQHSWQVNSIPRMYSIELG